MRFYPKQRITLNELKWQQEKRIDAVGEVLSILHPHNNMRGFFRSIDSDTTVANDYLLTGSYKTVELWMSDRVFGYGADGAMLQFQEHGSSAEPFSTSLKKRYSVSIENLPSGSVLLGASPTTTHWLNLFLVAGYLDQGAASETEKYIDHTRTFVVRSKVRLSPSLTVAPYLTNSVVSESDIAKNMRFLRTSSAAPASYDSISINESVQEEVLNLDGRTKRIKPVQTLANYVGSVLVQVTNPTLNTATTAIISAIAPNFEYQTFIGASVVSYDPSANNTTGTMASAATTMQNALDPLLSYLASYKMDIESLNTSISGAYPNASFIVTEACSAIASFSENINFPSTIGTRMDS